MPKPNQVKAYLELGSVDSYKDAKEYEHEIYESMATMVILDFTLTDEERNTWSVLDA